MGKGTSKREVHGMWLVTVLWHYAQFLIYIRVPFLKLLCNPKIVKVIIDQIRISRTIRRTMIFSLDILEKKKKMMNVF